MRRMLLWMLLCCTAATALGRSLASPLAVTSQGDLKGRLLKSRDGREYTAFTRVPFAKPPVGPLRFLPPEPAEVWSGVLDATQPTPTCYQQDMTTSAFTGQEDCLYLDIYSPNVNVTSSLPVIFSIHGGGFQIGSAGPASSNKYFMDEDVVLVTPNYRVGTLGFLSTEDEVIPGNMGLKDQALALQWVAKEIARFGGDPGLITVIGGSSGGVSSHLICSAPSTKGLIKGCVSQSGVGWAPWAFQTPGTSRQKAFELAQAVGCSQDNLLQCLQSKDVKDVADTNLMSQASFLSVGPVIEPPSVAGAFITKWPLDETQFPWITGVTHDEGLLITSEFELGHVSRVKTIMFIEFFDLIITTKVGLKINATGMERIKERFFVEGVKPLVAIRNFFTEYMFVYPSLKALRLHAGPKMFYNFNYIGGPASFNSSKISGVTHAGEKPYFFNVTLGVPPSAPGWPRSEDVVLSKLLVKMWANFATRQSPQIEGIVDWPLFSDGKYLDISNEEVAPRSDEKYQEVLQFWDSIL